jgi:hypothetical protein
MMMTRPTVCFLLWCFVVARVCEGVPMGQPAGPLLNISQELIASWQPASSLGCTSVVGPAEEEDFFWADDEETKCGSPSARPFILAKYGAVLSLEDLVVDGRRVSKAAGIF